MRVWHITKNVKKKRNIQDQWLNTRHPLHALESSVVAYMFVIPRTLRYPENPQKLRFRPCRQIQNENSQKRNRTDPSTPTAQTSVLSPRILSVPILSSNLPLGTSHFRMLLSEQPVTNHASLHSSSLSSSSLSLSLETTAVSLECLGTGGPQAMLRIRHLTRSKRRWCVRVSSETESKRTVPSSQPRASRVEAGFAAIHQIEPPWEFIVLYGLSNMHSWGRTGFYSLGRDQDAYPTQAPRCPRQN